MSRQLELTPQRGDALLLVDMQNDFLPGGASAVASGDQVIAVLNAWLARFAAAGLPVFATRDWHPAQHCSFQTQGGPWPPHCVASTHGAGLTGSLHWPSGTQIISKATVPDAEAYSGFSHTDLHERLQAAEVTRLFVGGLATDYCVLETVLAALQHGYRVVLLQDGVRAVEVQAGDGKRAIAQMMAAGAVLLEG
ncbi:isochorismatase family protein [Paludibacterium denitrificans]|uniref:nicotinamidase n=1 Tax=Paludibacterium denitrificans TaxID=2675226 RepID=A0A844G7N2_9NEIS|nr:isochorismatase family protein [Paludibacterium denitrificans]MTD32313.1 isochorismatase family protein [Paludibacterium denitrificans]